jgi:ribosomal protein S18 acetylase RimI-like enzyme
LREVLLHDIIVSRACGGNADIIRGARGEVGGARKGTQRARSTSQMQRNTVSGFPRRKAPSPERDIDLRPAKLGDYEFALALYLESTGRHLAALGRWDKARAIGRFRQAFKPQHAQVIRCDGHDIGWLQISESADGFHLQQLHIVARFRNRGIGTRLIEALLDRARTQGRPVVLNVVRGNPAISLYHRLGFRTVGRDEEKLRMRWKVPPGKHG